MKKTIIAAVLILFASCEKQPQEVTKTTNSEIDVELLFVQDGCKVYRFEDCGRYVYFTDCRGKTEYTRKEGKNSSVKVQNETVE